MPWHSHGWSTKDFLKEIDDLAQLYALSSCSTMATSMVASLGKKLSTAVSLRAGDYVSLMQHVDGSKLPEEQKLELQKTLGQVASSNGQLSVANKLANMLSVFLSKDKICAMEKGQGRFVHAACRSNPCPCDVDSIQSWCGYNLVASTHCFLLGKKAARALWLAGCSGNMGLQAI